MTGSFISISLTSDYKMESGSQQSRSVHQNNKMKTKPEFLFFFLAAIFFFF